jgi:hypothetical protein
MSYPHLCCITYPSNQVTCHIHIYAASLIHPIKWHVTSTFMLRHLSIQSSDMSHLHLCCVTYPSNQVTCHIHIYAVPLIHPINWHVISTFMLRHLSIQSSDMSHPHLCCITYPSFFVHFFVLLLFLSWIVWSSSVDPKPIAKHTCQLTTSHFTSLLSLCPSNATNSQWLRELTWIKFTVWAAVCYVSHLQVVCTQCIWMTNRVETKERSLH